MTRETEDALLAQLEEIRRETAQLIGRIVNARTRGERDEDAMKRLAEISRRQAELTRPIFEVLPA